MTPTVGVVTVAYRRRAHLQRQVHSLRSQSRPPDRYVVVDLGGHRTIVDQPPADELAMRWEPLAAHGAALPIGAARNVGADAADTDVVVFLDVDCVATPRLVEAYAEIVTLGEGLHAGPVGYLPPRAVRASWSVDALGRDARYQPGRPGPGTASHRTDRPELFWSLSFATSRETWRTLGGFDERYVGYGAEDTDLAWRARSLGIDIWFHGAPVAFHQHHPVSDPPVEHLDDICRNARTFFGEWGEWPMQGWLGAFRSRGWIEWDPVGSRLRRTSPDRASTGEGLGSGRP